MLALIFLSAQETRMYSGTHAMLVSCVCMVVAREMLRWSPAQVRRLGAAGSDLANIATTELQDQLAQQTQPLTARQIAAVEDHARLAAMLAELVTDAVRAEAVRHHHHRKPGPFAERPKASKWPA